jgi:hypothetical protein
MEKIMSRNGSCAVIRDNGVGVEIEYLGQHHSFPEVAGKQASSYAALIPNWKSTDKIRAKCGPGRIPEPRFPVRK